MQPIVTFVNRIKNHLLRLSVIAISVFFTLSLVSYHLFQEPYDSNSFIKRLDYLFYDWRYNLRLEEGRFPRADENIVIVDIDERSLKAEGRWPWPRDKLAQLVNALAQAGTVVIGFDVLLTEPQINPTRSLQQKALALGRQDIAEDLESFAEATDYDRILAESFSQADVVLAYLFHNDADIQVGSLPPPFKRLPESEAERLLTVNAFGYTASVPVLQEAAVGAGFIVPSIDGDGVLRRVPLVQSFDSGIYPSLALAMGMAYMFIDAPDVTILPFSDNLDMISKVDFVDQTVYTDINARVLVPYLGAGGQFPYVSATDVLNNSFEQGQFENALVLIGTSSIGLADLRSTPVGNQLPGVEVHASLLNGLLEGTFPVELVAANNISALLLLVLGVLFTAFSTRLGPFTLLLATLGLLGILLGSNLYFWFQHNLALPLATSFILTLALGTLHLLEGFLSERKAKLYVTNVFGQYVPKEHISHMLTEPEKYTFAGEQREMTVLFADIRSFTTISESLSATQLKDLLNRYFTPITETIFQHHGTIDKYVGDMVMAFWGAPLEDKRHALHALESAISMIELLHDLNPKLKKMNYPEVKIGVGLNTGVMNVGDMGSNFRKAYTVLGDSVNLGSRLESLTKFYGVDILVGAETQAQCPEWLFRFVDVIRVKGKKEAVKVYEPIMLQTVSSNEWFAELNLYDDAIRLYTNQQWSEAKLIFEQLKDSSSRAKLYDVYLQRIELLKATPPQLNWDGVFTHTEK